MSTAQATPLMKQYHEIKAVYPDTLLLFQVGDFYELFFDDAKRAASFLGIALTARGKNKGEPIPLCGVPVHARDYYLNKLIKGGFNVAICDQLEPARPGTVVQRGVTQVLTPGTLTEQQLLDEKSASYLCSLFPLNNAVGLVFGELLTAQLYATVIPATEKLVDAELARFFPDEIIMPHHAATGSLAQTIKQRGYCSTVVTFDHHNEQESQALNAWMHKQFKESAVAAVQADEAMRCALYYFYAYVKRNQAQALEQFHYFNHYRSDDFLIIDAATSHNLELVASAQDGSVKNSLFSVIDHAATAMGSRMIKKWLLRPLINQQAIDQRLDAVALLVNNITLSQQLKHYLDAIGDLERVIGRIALSKATVHDYRLLAHALTVVPSLQTLLASCAHLVLLRIMHNHVTPFEHIAQLLHAALAQDSSGYIIQKGFDQELDELRVLSEQSHLMIIDLELQEQKSTGINSLKIRYNQVQGYYIEITKTHVDSIPAHYIRQQTLAGRERYTIPELQQLAYAITQAKLHVNHVETAVFERIKKEVMLVIGPLRKLAYALAQLDALYGFAQTAYQYRYVRPTFNDEQIIAITDGRHPVVEHCAGDAFIANDTYMHEKASLWILTGPNMGGKSTYLRQVALITLLAHCGSFVPAQQANIMLADRIFTRIGAGDNLAEGKSTFLIEMEEVATICTQAKKRSLIILDEVGRGTSTFDGLALAQAIVEYVHNTIGARCLFATHYHELTALCNQHTGIVSYYAASKKTNNGIIFLHKIVPGSADGSFGIEVAQLAQLPLSITLRARALLNQLQAQGLMSTDVENNSQALDAVHKETEYRLSQTEYERFVQLTTTLNALHYDELSPKQALDILWKLKE